MATLALLFSPAPPTTPLASKTPVPSVTSDGSVSAPPSSPTTGGMVSFLGPGFDATRFSRPTRDSTQNRVWFHAGAWWTILLSTRGTGPEAGTDQRIFRLDPDAGKWIDTGTLVDERPDAHVDVLDAGDTIYVASSGWGKGPRNGGRLYRFDYEQAAGRYTIAPDSPTSVSSTGMRSLVVARDESGQLWVAGVADGQLLVAHSMPGSPVWSTPTTPGSAAVGHKVDVASIAIVGGMVDVAWIGADTGLVVSRHPLGSPDDDWKDIPIELEGGVPLVTDLDAIAAPGPSGDRLLVTGGALYPKGTATAASPDMVVVALEPDGTWRAHLLSHISDHLSHPHLLVDADGTSIYALVTGPNGSHGNAVFIKQSPIDPISFTSARGAPLIAPDASTPVDFATTTGQPVDRNAGLVALASSPAGSYATGFMTFGADFPVPPALPPAPEIATLLRDTFDDYSAGAPLGGLWLAAGGGPGAVTVATISGDPSPAARLITGSAGVRTRVCRTFAPVPTGVLRFSTLIRYEAAGTGDGTIAIRAAGQDIAVGRFRAGGILGYFNGSRLVSTNAHFRAGVWYRSLLAADTRAHTYAWRVEEASGRLLLNVKGLHWQSVPADPLSAACIEAPSGRPRQGVDFDDVLVTH